MVDPIDRTPGLEPVESVVERYTEHEARPIGRHEARWDVQTPCLGCSHVSVCAIREQLTTWRDGLRAQLPVLPNGALSATASLDVSCVFYSPVKGAKKPGRTRTISAEQRQAASVRMTNMRRDQEAEKAARKAREAAAGG